MIEDEDAAKIFLSGIINEEVLELEFATQDHKIRRYGNDDDTCKNKPFLHLCRFDLFAKVLLPSGKIETRLIKLQKADSQEILQLWYSIGMPRRNPVTMYGRTVDRMYCIFIVTGNIKIPNCPIVFVESKIEDCITGEEIQSDDAFLKSLHAGRRTWIIQVDQLIRPYEEDVMKYLKIFDQERYTPDRHVADFDENEYFDHYRPLIHRLHLASENEDVKAEMRLEDDFYAR
jgi:hypothetical protein